MVKSGHEEKIADDEQNKQDATLKEKKEDEEKKDDDEQDFQDVAVMKKRERNHLFNNINQCELNGEFDSRVTSRIHDAWLTIEERACSGFSIGVKHMKASLMKTITESGIASDVE
ncbi:hypothetical protein CAPTEDRAFT_192350 [Capitella teleta]|uniref:Uncharacterized protein n=1 Tax=Capitella teleta TaxID=283909 RepID=R7T767_CAPTE|nr:hypothetical protein CAPTEDRAFT_192350 [Capitella teleta]|eukprot:ELT89223.1 hypothetical protein CAPTEDRAFT_192350 [Capitella teleta]